MRTASCLYEGTIRHRRSTEVADEFRHRLFMAYLDLDELPTLFDGWSFASARGPALAWFRRADYLGDPAVPLATAVRELVLERTAIELDGPIRLLTHMRCFGHCFNPVSFYYCFNADGSSLRAVIAHVTNTPWGERHAYVLPVGEVADHGTATLVEGRMEKLLHVSPLLAMEHTYDWRMTEPAERLQVHISAERPDGETAFDATLGLRRRELSRRSLAGSLARYPLLTVRMLLRIYTHALRLRLRGARYHRHPGQGAVSV